jgi:hypothetical protein
MGEVNSTNDPTRREIDLVAAQLQWHQTAALARDASRSTNVCHHREAVQVAKSALARIDELVEAAARGDSA